MVTKSNRHLPLLHARYMPAVCPQYARNDPALGAAMSDPENPSIATS
jgi:hypothetical protein